MKKQNDTLFTIWLIERSLKSAIDKFDEVREK
jgi:hypothetical protein